MKELLTAVVDLSQSFKLVNVSPPGWGGTVRAMKKHKDIDNPFALCLGGDTEVPCLDGKIRSLHALAEANAEFWLYSVDPTGIVVPGLARVKYVGVRPAVEIALDNGEILTCSPEHRWVKRDGSFVETKALNVDDSLMPFRTTSSVSKSRMARGIVGHEMVYHPGLGCYGLTHWAVMREMGLGCPSAEHVGHHLNEDPRDNRPENLVWMLRDFHNKHHGKDKVQAMRLAWDKKWRSDPEFRRLHTKKSKETTLKQWAEMSPEERERRSGLLRDQSYRSGLLGGRPFGTSQSADAIEKIRQANLRRNYGSDHGKKVGEGKRRAREAREAQNHFIVKIDFLDTIIPMYDVAVKGIHTFAISAGVFSHNSYWMKSRGDKPHHKED